MIITKALLENRLTNEFGWYGFLSLLAKYKFNREALLHGLKFGYRLGYPDENHRFRKFEYLGIRKYYNISTTELLSNQDSKIYNMLPDKIKIYRGARVDEKDFGFNLSWSLSKAQAFEHAKTLKSGERTAVFTTMIDKSQILDIYIDQFEDEILVNVNPNLVTEIEGDCPLTLKYILNYLLIFDESTSRKILLHRELLYSELEFSYIESLLHSQSHCERVLLLSMIIAHESGIFDDKSLEILCQSSIFHDSKRIDDWEDAYHGARSATYYKDYTCNHKMIFYPEVYQIIKHHDVPDVKGYEAILGDASISDKGTAIICYKIIKDADSLDRIRFSGLDISYLRTEPAKYMVDLVNDIIKYSCYMKIKEDF